MTQDEEAVASHAKAQENAKRMNEMKDDDYKKMKKLDLKASHRRCFSGDNHGTANLRGV